MLPIDSSVYSRTLSHQEKQAYINLKFYDYGLYKIKNELEIKNILDSASVYPKINSRVLNINLDEINMFLQYAQLINYKHSDFNPGKYVEKSSYESSFAKKGYFDNELEFIISLFISHHKIHAFYDGNKRTALNIFVDLISKYTNFYIENILVIQDSQILFLEKMIDENEFKKIIYFEVKTKMFKTNLKCNLEHLIPRGNVEASNSNIVHTQSDRRSSFNLTDLEKGQFFYQQLKKPIFQRDTNQWTVERVEKLINTFLDDGLIPAIILWEDLDGDIYIIDGAHRISSLIAWVNSDYGKENELNDSNHLAIEEYLNEKIGSYSEIKYSKDDKYKNIKQIIAKRSISVQWVTGNYDKVKESFIRINEQGVVISEDEKELIENDQLPISKLSRSILGHGLGQTSINQNQNTEQIFNRFFIPYLSHQLKNYPLVGSLNEDFIISKVYNVVKIIDNNQGLDLEMLEEKVLQTLIFIQDKLNISQKAYFYGATKQFKTNTLYGFIRFSLELMKDQSLYSLFVKNRGDFEEFLIANEKHIQNIARKKRQAKRAYEEVCSYYEILLHSCENDDFTDLKAKYYYLDFGGKKHHTQKEKTLQKNYEKFITEIPRCIVCSGFIDGNIEEEKIHNCCKITNDNAISNIQDTQYQY